MKIRQQEIDPEFDLTTASFLEKYQTISIKFKIYISQLLAKIFLKQQRLNEITVLRGIFQSDIIIFIKRKLSI